MDIIDYSQYMFTTKSNVVDQDSSVCDEVLATLTVPIDGKEQIVEDQHIDTTRKYMFVTLNSDKELNNFQYNKVIKSVISRVNYNKKLNLIFQWYFESKSKEGLATRNHVHGMISNVPATFYPYGGLCNYISHQFHKQIGRARVKHSVCAHVEWAHSNQAVADYCLKQKGRVNYYNNVYK